MPTTAKFDTVLKNLDGTPISMDGKEATLSTIACNALLMPKQSQNEPDVSGDEKVKRYALAMKVHGKGAVELTDEESVLIKTQVDKLFGPLIVGQVRELMSGKPAENPSSV